MAQEGIFCFNRYLSWFFTYNYTLILQYLLDFVYSKLFLFLVILEINVNDDAFELPLVDDAPTVEDISKWFSYSN